MKKQNHPKKLKTTIIMSDGSQIKLNWIYTKRILKLESDFLNNPLWKHNKKFFKAG